MDTKSLNPSESEEERYQNIAAAVVASFPNTREGFHEASGLYGSTFFTGESLYFRQLLCKAQSDKFKGIGTNNYWVTMSMISTT